MLTWVVGPSSNASPTLTIYDLSTGAATQITDGSDDTLQNFGTLLGWSPDGAWFFAGLGARLVAYRSETGEVIDVPFDSPSGAISVIGVA